VEEKEEVVDCEVLVPLTKKKRREERERRQREEKDLPVLFL